MVGIKQHWRKRGRRIVVAGSNAVPVCCLAWLAVRAIAGAVAWNRRVGNSDGSFLVGGTQAQKRAVLVPVRGSSFGARLGRNVRTQLLDTFAVH